MEEPGITLVIPLRDEERSVPALFSSIVAQKRAPHRVIFVDAGSTDSTLARPRQESSVKSTWSVLAAGPASPGRAPNAGIEAATTEWVRHLDPATTALGAVDARAPEAVARWSLAPDLRRTYRRFRLYSEVNAAAGERRYWHHGVARMYLSAAPFALLALRRRKWLLLPGLGLLARVEKSIWRRRRGRGVLWVANPARIATVAVVLAAVDAATSAGWARPLRDRADGR